ncbi:hypothetical protein ACP70R_040826 [Stipagrostis hirtigluma subsp. patula]
MDAATCPDEIMPIHDSLPLLSSPPQDISVYIDPSQDVSVYMEKMMKQATERLENQVTVKPTRIHKFPHNLRGIGGGAEDRYVVPSVVAIGPYHRGLPHLEEMEEIKLVAAYNFCRDSGCSVKDVYDKISSVAGDARSCYTSTHLSDAKFMDMMVLDGCFLLQLMTKQEEPPIAGRLLSSGHSICKDIFLLENQIPWLVLEALMELRPMVTIEGESKPTVEAVRCWIFAVTGRYFFERKEKKAMWFQRFLQDFLMKCRRTPEERTLHDGSSIRNGDGDSKPPHLLGLLRSLMVGDMPSQKRKGEYTKGRSHLSLSSSAVYLAQIGMKLTASRAAWFADVKVKKKPVFGELSLSPLFLNDIAACCLVNLAALEAAEAASSSSFYSDGFVVTSYLSVLAMLMDREEDVHQLRHKGVLGSRFSKAQTLAFFKGLGQHLCHGYNYNAVTQEIYDYIRTKTVRIALHKFVYNNYKVIAAVLSIAGVLAGIFRALYSLKKP